MKKGFTWVDEFFEHEHEKFELMDVLVEFQTKFPTNMDNSYHKRLNLIEEFRSNVLTLDYDYDIKKKLIYQLDELITLIIGNRFDKIYSNFIRKRIKIFKKNLIPILDDLVLSNEYYTNEIYG